MASFDGQSFGEGVGQTEFQHPTAKAQVETQYLAGGGMVLDFSGQIEQKISVTALCTGEELVGLRSKIGDVGTLVLGAGSYADCFLEEVSDPKELLISGLYEVILTLTIGVDQVDTIACSVIVDGVRLSDVLSVSTSVGKSQPVGTATINVRSHPGVTEGASVDIYVAVSGAAAVAIWRGRVEQFSYDYYPGVVTVECRGRMARLTQPWGADVERVYSSDKGNSDDAVIIRNLIEAWGNSSGDHSIESSGWTLATIQDIVVRKGDSFASLIAEIDEVAGYWTYDNHDGAIYRRQRQPYGAGGSAVAALVQGTNILSISRKQDTSQIVNHCIVEGYVYDGVEVKQEFKASSSILDAYAPATAPNYRATTIKSDLIEFDAMAMNVATRVVDQRNRRAESLEITTLLDPAITPGVSVSVTAAGVGIGSAMLFVVDQVKHSIDGGGATTSFTTNAGSL